MKPIMQAREDEAKIYNLMWDTMSAASRCKIQEQGEYAACNIAKDPVEAHQAHASNSHQWRRRSSTTTQHQRARGSI